ncbi:MAG: hypothetical protein LRY73_04270 [Bacillus sp. (in: Bacteria)]|nr:hypothetical protein [Bacillus sp. (in: firmicutes)]
MEYLLVAATVIFIIGFIITFQGLLKEVNEDTTKAFMQKIQTKLFVRLAFIEMIPIALIIIAFITLEGQTIDPAVPLIMVIVVFILGLLRIFSVYRSKKERLNEAEVKSALTMMFTISIPLITAIPIISIVVLIIFSGGSM